MTRKEWEQIPEVRYILEYDLGFLEGSPEHKKLFLSLEPHKRYEFKKSDNFMRGWSKYSERCKKITTLAQLGLLITRCGGTYEVSDSFGLYALKKIIRDDDTGHVHIIERHRRPKKKKT